MEKVMDVCRMTPEDKVFFVPHQLTGLADLWWDGVREAWPPARGAITWEVFIEQFRAKYYPESFRDRMSDALNHIRQGSKIVDVYEREFDENPLGFVPDLSMGGWGITQLEETMFIARLQPSNGRCALATDTPPPMDAAILWSASPGH